ncbi:glycosyltransferase family 4 protein [Paenibacillus pasadenensis]|uniref:glycosyltransferase family 4 protein n=1 Tax=Paenibacillus pasadenensis TaxID=217090 RepID=UPI00203F842F|nr:glycosyltransferase family 4 protein [Paenibacillus pasadenensis]MCM3746829.1 glycosyltransferase family 4 protein [Paenibacillus pasadenensis]
MRLAFVCTEKLPSPAIRGGAIQIMIDGVLPVLSKQHQMTVYSITDEQLPIYEVRSGVTYYRYPREVYIAKVAESLKQHKYDVVHVFNRPKNLIRLKSASPSSRFVVSLHNEMFHMFKLSDADAQLSVRYASQITTVSNFIKRTVTERVAGSDNKVKTVYSGFDPSTFHPVWTAQGQQIRRSMRAEHGLENKKVILYVGRLSVKKGPHLLIQSMEHVLREHPNAVLVIVGGKWFSDDTVDKYGRILQRLAKPYGSKVIFTKYVPSDEIQNYYLMSDVFVCSSQWQEPLARVHYEAMAAGIPIITTNRGGNGEIVTHGVNGYIVREYKKVESFAGAISFMLSNPQKALQMARNGRQKAESSFTFEHVAERLNNVYIEAYRSVPTKMLIDRKAAFMRKRKATAGTGKPSRKRRKRVRGR